MPNIQNRSPEGASLAYTYDVLDRLRDKLPDSHCFAGATTYSYDPAENLSGYAYSNTLQTGNIFDPLNRLTARLRLLPPARRGRSWRAISTVWVLQVIG